jgi:hypothetical protein
MLPHPETVCMLKTMEHQERLREAAKEQIAASAQSDRRSPMTTPGAARRIVASWLSELRLRALGSTSMRAPFPMASDQARPAGHGA